MEEPENIVKWLLRGASRVRLSFEAPRSEAHSVHGSVAWPDVLAVSGEPVGKIMTASKLFARKLGCGRLGRGANPGTEHSWDSAGIQAGLSRYLSVISCSPLTDCNSFSTRMYPFSTIVCQIRRC